MGKKEETCLHDGGTRRDGSWGGCLLAKHEKCKPACKDRRKT